MTITGGFKFFLKSKSLASDGATAEATSATETAVSPITRNNYTVWRTVGSNDATVETWTLTLPEPQEISRLFILNHNFKDFSVQFLASEVWTEFSLVTGLDGSLSGINETNFVDGTSYYEFVKVTTDGIRIQISTTQITNEEKTMGGFVITEELGTLEGYPIVSSLSKDTNLRKKKTLNGRVFVQKAIETKRMSLNFKNYPSGLEADLDLIVSLFNRDDSFLVWPCGGRRGSVYFGYTFVGFRLQDLIQMQTTNTFKDSYKSNFYRGVVKMKLRLEESV